MGALPQRLSHWPRLASPRARALETFRPAKLEIVIPAGFFDPKASSELRRIPGVILHDEAILHLV